MNAPTLFPRLWIGTERAWRLVRLSASAWVDDYAPSMGAALAYYTIFSLAPLLIIVIAVAGLVFGADAARGEIVAQLRGLIGDEGAVAVQGMLKSASAPAGTVFGSIAALITMVLGATTSFGELQDDLDRIWRAPALARKEGVWALIRSRVLSFEMIVVIGFLLVVSLVVSAGLSAFSKWWGPWMGHAAAVFQLLNFIVSFGIITILFALIYKILPRVPVTWRDVWIGAAVTALLFTGGKSAIGLYIGRSGLTSAFGAAGSVIALIVWIYYSAQIFLFGAEFTCVYAHSHGSRRSQVPSRAAVVRDLPLPSVSDRPIGRLGNEVREFAEATDDRLT